MGYKVGRNSGLSKNRRIKWEGKATTSFQTKVGKPFIIKGGNFLTCALSPYSTNLLIPCTVP
jgi:hypothetical protein